MNWIKVKGRLPVIQPNSDEVAIIGSVLHTDKTRTIFLGTFSNDENGSVFRDYTYLSDPELFSEPYFTNGRETLTHWAYITDPED